MNNAGQKFTVGGICRPDGAGPVCGVLATKMSLLAELGWLIMPGLEIESRFAATEWRQIVAHSASCGLAVLVGKSSVGAVENSRHMSNFFRPSGALNHFTSVPTVCTVGYYRPLLRS
jgi:hypothetical protein